jgi:NodT family efflux transporter outer membrane factor (OMF) lipoprotein
VVGVPSAYAGPQATGDVVDTATWWRAFGDPVLDGLVARALTGNPDMATAASRVRQARLQEIAARAAGLPSVGASAQASRIEFSRNAGFSSLARQFSGGSEGGSGSAGGIALPGSGITTFATGFDVSWEIDLFGGIRRAREAAAARTEVAEWTRADAAVTLAAEVAQAYFALRLDQAQTAILADEIARQRRALEIAGNVARVGLVPAIDVTRQRAQLTSTEARLEPVRADAQVRIHALGILIGTAPATLAAELTAPSQVPAVLPIVPAGLPSDLLRRRPDVRAAERRLAASSADIGVAVADLYPRFSLTGIAQLISTGLSSLIERDSLQLTGSTGLNVPIVDFGRRRATVESRREDREQAYIAYEATVLRSLRDVEDALARIDAERRRHASLVRAVADAEASAKATDAQYRTGFVAQDSLLNAEVAVLTAREQVAGSDAQLRQLTATLFKAMGGGWFADMPLPNRPDR